MSPGLSRRQLLRYGAAAAAAPVAAACTKTVDGSGTPGGAPTGSPSPGPSGGPSTGPSSGPSSGPSPSPSPTQAPPQPLELWMRDNTDYRQGTEERISGFPGPEIHTRWFPNEALEPTYRAAEAAGNQPDVLEYEVDLSLIKRDDLVAVDDVVASVRGDFLSGTIGSEMVGSTLYGVPTWCSAYVLFYSKSALRKAKLDPPGNLDALVDATTKLNKGGQKGLYLGKDGGAWMAPAFLQAAGLRLVSKQNRLGFNSVWAAEALRKLRDLNDSPGLMRSGGEDWWDISPLMTGETAMQWSGSWVLSEAKAALGNDLGVAALPRLNQAGLPVVPVGTSSAVILRATEDVEAAKKLVTWMWVYQRDLVKAIGGDKLTEIPARKNAIGRVPQFASGVGAEIVELVKKWGVPYGHPAWSADIAQRLEQAATNVIHGKDATKEISAAIKDIRPMLADALN